MSVPEKTENINSIPLLGFSPAVYYLLFTTGVIALGAIGAAPASLTFLLASSGIIGCSTDLGKEELNLFKNVLMPHKVLSVGVLLTAAGIFGGSALMLLSGFGLLGARYQYADFVQSFEKKLDMAFDFISLICQKAGISAPPIGQALVVFKGAVQTAQYVATTAKALREKPLETVKQEVVKATVVAGEVATYIKENPIQAARIGSSVAVGTIATIAAASAINVISSAAANVAYAVPVVGPVLSPIVWLGTEAFGHWLTYSVPAEWTRRGFDAAREKIGSYFAGKADKPNDKESEQILRLEHHLETLAVKPELTPDAEIEKPKAAHGGSNRYVPSYAAGFLGGEGCSQLPLMSNMLSMLGLGFGRHKPRF